MRRRRCLKERAPILGYGVRKQEESNQKLRGISGDGWHLQGYVTDKTSLKADREDWGGEGGLLLAPELAPQLAIKLAPQLAPQLTPQLAPQLAP